MILNRANSATEPYHALCREGKEQGEEPTLFITSVLVCQLSSGRAVHPGRNLKQHRVGEEKGKVASVGGGEKKIAVNKEKNKYKQIQRGRKEKDSEMLEMGGEASSSSSKQSCERSNPSY